MAITGRTGVVGVYGGMTRRLQKAITRESFGLTFKEAEFYLYLGVRDSAAQSVDEIQDNILFETRDREYDTVPKIMPISMEEKSEQVADYSQFGYIDPIGNKTIFRLFTDDMVEFLGRKIVVGDVFEIPFNNIDGNREFWQVSDVDDSQQAEKFITVLTAEPMDSTVETSDIPVDGDDLDSIFTDLDAAIVADIPADVDVAIDEVVTEQNVDYRPDNQQDFLDDY